MALIEEALTYRVIGAAFAVHNRLGFGFRENVYLGAMVHECDKRGLAVARELPVAVRYDGAIVGHYRVDLLVERRLIVEIKACDPHPEHDAQLINYLRSTDIEVGLILYFGRHLKRRRFVFRNALKCHINERLQHPRPRPRTPR